ncbi:primase-helicase family protein [Bradyrhizobium erythrophlei]|nr:primase-helicase family protein [Bradyrhizobium erythrophlei]
MFLPRVPNGARLKTKMTDRPDTNQSTIASVNPALTGGVFRSGSENPHETIAALIDGGDDSEAVEAENTSPRAWGFDVEEINRSYALAIWGGKAVVVNEQPSGPVNDRVRVMSFESMNPWFANRYTEIVGSDGKVRPVTWAKAWHSHRDRRQYDGVEFFPNPDGAAGTPSYLNFWRGFDVKPSPAGSYHVFRDHLLTNVCGGDENLFKYVFGWMAHIVQKPRERLGTAIVLRGRRGTGKSKVGEVLGSLFSSHYFQVDEARYITGQFNAHMASCLLLQADEAVWAGDKAAEGRLKGLITSETQMIESKGVDPIRLRNFLRVIMTSNEGWVVPAGMDERRFCVLDVGSGCAQNHEYFGEMDDELNAGGRERLLHDLLNFDLTQVDLWHAPQTRALLEQKIRSFDTIDDFWYNRLYDGSDWPSRVICTDFHSEYIKATTQMGVGRKRSNAEFGTRLAKLVPSMRKTRPAIETEPGVTRRVWCYEFPSLDDCRAAFDELLGQPVDWPALSPGEGGRALKSSSDDSVPV